MEPSYSVRAKSRKDTAEVSMLKMLSNVSLMSLRHLDLSWILWFQKGSGRKESMWAMKGLQCSTVSEGSILFSALRS